MKKLFLVLLFSTALISCSSSSDSDNLNSNLSGRWNLTSYDASMPEPLELTEGTIVWTFNMESKTVNIYQAPEISFRYLEKNTYRISGDESSIKLGNNHKFSYRFENGKLILDANTNGANDEAVITFSR